MDKKIYDIIIIGGGPAGLTAAIYALRSGRSVLIIEKAMVGGQVAITKDVQNYPGYDYITGFELSMKMHEQAEKLGSETAYGEVTDVELDGQIKKIVTTAGEFLGRAVIIATGAKSRKIGIENEERLTGSGVAYCAVCDGAFFKDANVALLGGGNSGVEDAIYLSGIVKHLTLIHLYDNFKAQQILVDELHEKMNVNKNITIIPNSTITKITGNNKLESIEVTQKHTKETQKIDVDGLFIAIGRIPDTEFLKGKINLNKFGYIETDSGMRTNIEGVFAAGDVRDSALKQIVTATSDGAIAATNANIYLNQIKK